MKIVNFMCVFDFECGEDMLFRIWLKIFKIDWNVSFV